MSLAPGLLSGAKNFRAVEPYKATDGRHLRAGLIYRSGELSRLDETDLATVSTLGIRLICDLRSAHEQTEFLSRWPDGGGHELLELPDRESANAEPDQIFALIRSHEGQAGALLAMDMLYRRKPKAFANNLKRLFDAILAGGALPVLIHCHAGKDRTGFMVAMLLAAVNISLDDIFDDYVTTAQHFSVETETVAMVEWSRRSFGQDLDPVAAVPLAETRRDYIAASFDEIRTVWGDVDRYLATAVGISTAERASLCDLLLA